MLRAALTALLLLFALAGCGYKPASAYVKNALHEKMYVHVDVLLRDPEDALLIKDTITHEFARRFGRFLTHYDEADTKIYVKVRSLSFTTLERDIYGYVDNYRTTITLEFDVRGKKRAKIVTSGYYDFAIEPNSIITDALRFRAIEEASSKAIDKFIARLAYIGAL